MRMVEIKGVYAVAILAVVLRLWQFSIYSEDNYRVIGYFSSLLCIGYGIPQVIFFFDVFISIKIIKAEGLQKYDEASLLKNQLTVFKVTSLIISFGFFLTEIVKIIFDMATGKDYLQDKVLGVIGITCLVFLLVAFIVSVSLLN